MEISHPNEVLQHIYESISLTSGTYGGMLEVETI